MTISAQAMASYEKEAAYRDTFYGGNAAVAALRCFKRYHKDAHWEMRDPMGRLRWVTNKQARIHAVLMRNAVSGERTTMTLIAQETLCATSTVSRAILRFQSWGMFAIDVARGRNGGISVRLRTISDGLQSYAKAAWQRITAAANRARINVASLINLKEEGYREPDYETSTELTTQLLVTMDATFNEAWDAVERNGRILAAQTPSDSSLAFAGPARNGSADGTRLGEHVAGAWNSLIRFKNLHIQFPELERIEDDEEYLERVSMLQSVRLPNA